MIDSSESEHSKVRSTIRKTMYGLRGTFDYWDIRQYVFGILFYRYLSEDLILYVNKKKHGAGEQKFNYASLSNSKAERLRGDILGEKGFFILPDELFENVCKRTAKDTNLNENLETVFKNLETSSQGTGSESSFKGLFDDLDLNSSNLGKTVAERNNNLAMLLEAIGNLPIENFQSIPGSPFGLVFECLMTTYAAFAGRFGRKFFTPPEVSELLVRLVVSGKTSVNKVYDPTCGTGSLLLKFAEVLGKENVHNGFFGQEIDTKSYNLCRINMLLHGISFEQFHIASGNTLIDHLQKDNGPFEAVVSNPPYSFSWKGDSDPELKNDPRFKPAKVLAPQSMADFAFVMHSLSCLDAKGTAAIVSYPGALYRIGSEQWIRKYLIDKNHVEAVIQLPSGLFFGTSHAFCILVLKKNRSDSRVLFIDATDECKGDFARSKMDQMLMNRILDCYARRETHEQFSRLVEKKEIADNDYNFQVCNYVQPKGTIESLDISKLNADIEAITARQNRHRVQVNAIVADLERGVEWAKFTN